MNPKLKPVATIGDIVTIEGYARRLFRVDGYTHEFMYDEDGANEDLWYDVSCVITGDYTIGAHDEVKLVCKAEYSDQFIAEYQHPEMTPLNSGLEIVFTMETEAPAEVAPPKPKIRTKVQTQIDELLDELNDKRSLIATIGDADGEYARQISEVQTKLRALMEGV